MTPIIRNVVRLPNMDLLIFVLLLQPFVACDQLRVGDYRRSGAQSAILNNTLWIVGGLDIWTNGSGASPSRNLTSIDLSNPFSIPSTFTALARPQDPVVPLISNGTLWSNNVDTFWLFGGVSSGQSDHDNTLWRFNSSSGNWTHIDKDSANLTGLRPSDGAGCSDPLRSRGYYLGGMAKSVTSSEYEYLHSMTVFDMKTERTSVMDVPLYVPVIGHNLVFLSVGKEGLLIALGGQQESNGTLERVSLNNVYIFDIASASWTVQPTTDEAGGSETVLGSHTQRVIGIPERRDHMCTVTGTAADESSYNLYVFGGKNESHTMEDVWVLSMPSAIWVSMNTSDTTNSPKVGSTCNVIHDRYALLADGCWGTGIGNCYSYGWNPGVYDLCGGDWEWNYNPSVVGYTIPIPIRDIIGGSDMGDADYARPKFTSFNDTHLANVFKRPSTEPVKYYHLALAIGIPVLFFVSLGAQLFSVARSLFRRPPLCLFKSQARNISNWQQTSRKSNTGLFQTFHTHLITATVALIGTIACLLALSSLPDLDASHWRAGDTSAGSWTGRPFASQFIPKGNKRPTRGLISFYLDTGNSGNYDRKNTSQRMGTMNNVLWTFFPSFIAVLYGVIWMIIDGETKRLEKFRQLSRPAGCQGASSICLDYHCFWAPLAVFQAIRHRQWAVISSGIGYTLALLAIPNIQNYVFVWKVNSGGYFDWGAEYSWQTGQVDPYWAKVLLGVLAVNLLCALCLFPVQRFHFSGMTELNGIGTITELVGDKVLSDFDLDSRHENGSFTDIASVVWKQQFRIDETDSSMRLERIPSPTTVRISTTPSSQSQYSRYWKAFIATQRLWNVCSDKISKYLGEFEKWMDGSPYPFLLRPVPFALWIIFLTLLLAANTYVVRNMTTPQQLSDQNYALPWNPSLYIVTGVFIQSIFQLLERNTRDMALLDSLRQGFVKPSILFEDYSSSKPIVEIFSAFSNGHSLLGYVTLTSSATGLYTVLLGTLQVSASFYGATTFGSDLACAIATLFLNVCFLLVSVAVGWRYSGRRRFINRSLGTMVAVMPLVLSSEKLKEDVASIRLKGSQREKIQYLENSGRRYGFGYFYNAGDANTEHFGVERNETNARQGGGLHVRI